MRGLLEEHDNLIEQYHIRRRQAESAKAKGDEGWYCMMTGFAEGISYVYCQLFGEPIENAHKIGYYEPTPYKWGGIWKWKEEKEAEV